MALMPWGDMFGTSLFDPYAMLSFPAVGTRQQQGSRQQQLVQPMDIEETDKSYEIYSDVPGMSPEEVTLEYSDTNQVLTIKGEHKEDKKVKERGGFTRTERVRRSFTRSFTVPSDALPDQMTATIENGVLNVHVPKKPVEPQVKAAPRRIPITGGASTKAHIGGSGDTKQAKIGGAGDVEGSTGAGGVGGTTGGAHAQRT